MTLLLVIILTVSIIFLFEYFMSGGFSDITKEEMQKALSEGKYLDRTHLYRDGKPSIVKAVYIPCHWFFLGATSSGGLIPFKYTKMIEERLEELEKEKYGGQRFF